MPDDFSIESSKYLTRGKEILLQEEQEVDRLNQKTYCTTSLFRANFLSTGIQVFPCSNI